LEFFAGKTDYDNKLTLEEKVQVQRIFFEFFEENDQYCIENDKLKTKAFLLNEAKKFQKPIELFYREDTNVNMDTDEIVDFIFEFENKYQHLYEKLGIKCGTAENILKSLISSKSTYKLIKFLIKNNKSKQIDSTIIDDDLKEKIVFLNNKKIEIPCTKAYLSSEKNKELELMMKSRYFIRFEDLAENSELSERLLSEFSKEEIKEILCDFMGVKDQFQLIIEDITFSKHLSKSKHDYFIKEGKCKLTNKKLEEYYIKNFLHYDFLEEFWNVKEYAYLVINSILKDWNKISENQSKYFKKSKKGVNIKSYLEYFLKNHAVFLIHQNEEFSKSESLLAPTQTIMGFIRNVKSLERINEKLNDNQIKIARLNDKEFEENLQLTYEQAAFFGFKTYIDPEQILSIFKDITSTCKAKVDATTKERYFSIMKYISNNYENYKESCLFENHKGIKLLNLKECFVSREKNLKHFIMWDSFNSTKDDIYTNELLKPIPDTDMEKLCHLFKIKVIKRPSCTGRNLEDDTETKDKIKTFLESKLLQLTDAESKRLKENLDKSGFNSCKYLNLFIQLSTKVDLIDKRNLPEENFYYQVYRDGENVYYFKNDLQNDQKHFLMTKFVEIILSILDLNEKENEDIFKAHLPDHIRNKDIPELLTKPNKSRSDDQLSLNEAQILNNEYQTHLTQNSNRDLHANQAVEIFNHQFENINSVKESKYFTT
jgi:hypothetical protein